MMFGDEETLLEYERATNEPAPSGFSLAQVPSPPRPSLASRQLATAEDSHGICLA